MCSGSLPDWNWNWYTNVCLTTPCASTGPSSALVHLESFEYWNLERPREVVWRQDPRKAPREVAQKGLFWELAPQGVIGKPAELNCANVEREWRRWKHKTEKASRRSLTGVKNSPRTTQLREYALREFWEICVDDRSQHVFQARKCSI